LTLQKSSLVELNNQAIKPLEDSVSQKIDAITRAEDKYIL
jgi:hypothetical protein